MCVLYYESLTAIFLELATSKRNNTSHIHPKVRTNLVLSDVGECGDPLLNDCTQTCTNTVGGYACGCKEGFTKYNATFCKGKTTCCMILVC